MNTIRRHTVRSLFLLIAGGLLGATLVRGLLLGASADTALVQGWLALLIFAPLGAVIGLLAEWIVDQSVQQLIDQEIAAQQAPTSTAARN